MWGCSIFVHLTIGTGHNILDSNGKFDREKGLNVAGVGMLKKCCGGMLKP